MLELYKNMAFIFQNITRLLHLTFVRVAYCIDCSSLFQAVKSGLLKILSKMGISLLSRYKLRNSSFLVFSTFWKSIYWCFVNFTGKLTCLFSVFSYCGAQIFEIYGLGKEIVDLAFCGSVSNIGGATFDEVIWTW